MKMALLFCFIFLNGCCASPRDHADQLANNAHFVKEIVCSKDFNLMTYHKPFQPKQPLTIYIEGDGHSFANRYTVSADPTPHQPLGLKLALLDTTDKTNVVYLARPCQYVDLSGEKNCHPDIWSFKRFSEPVIANMNEAIDKLKAQTQAEQLHLIGFSGGAAITVLIAARRNDIASIKTVAGDLDPALMTGYHQTTPLTDCLNPKDFAAKIARIPQWHYVGDCDPIVPSFITQSFVSEIAKTHPKHANISILPNVSHHEGWEKKWPDILSQNKRMHLCLKNPSD